MPLLCFVLDTSASMNQKTLQGQRLIDHAKTTIENFISKVRCKDPSARTDQYLLVTTHEDGLRVGLKDTPTAFWQELRSTQAHGLSNLGLAIQLAFDLVNSERWENELDSIGRGRLPWMIKPASIVVITDGGKLTSQGNIKSELVIPGSNLPGANLILEPFRWDQRVFSLTLRFSASDEVDNTHANATDQLAPLCDVTGGRSHIVTTPKNLTDTLQAIGSKIHSSAGTGVMVNFEKITDKAVNGRPELSEAVNDSKPWHNTKAMVYVRQNYKTGNFQGFWPIPESYWADPNEAQCPPRKANPLLKFSCKDCKPVCLSNFAFDKLELEASQMTAAMLDRKRPDVCWQVFVEGSGKFGGIGKPIGYLKPNSQNTIVNLFIHPYDYEEALVLIEELFRSSMNPTPQWRKQWEEYLTNIPNYYISHFRKALVQARAPAGIIQESFETKLNSTLSAQFKKIKLQLRTESEHINEQIKKNRSELNMEKPIKVHISHKVNDKSDYTNIDLLNKQRNIRKRPYLEAFDVARDKILSELNRMRIAFRQSLKCGIPIHKEHILHEQSISQMGLYQQYIKNNVQPLRDPDPDARPSAKPTFGNPWKRGARGDNLDVDGIDAIDGINDRLNGVSGQENRNRRNRRKGETEKPKKRVRKLSSLSLRRRSVSSDNESVSSASSSDVESENDSEVYAKETDSTDHTKHNGYHHNSNINEIESKINTDIKKVNSHNENIFQQLYKHIKTFGIQDKEFCKKLSQIELDNIGDVGCNITKLQLETYRYKRWSLHDLLEDYSNTIKE